MIDLERIDDLVMTYAKAADGIGCERGSHLYDEISRGLAAVLIRLSSWNPIETAPRDPLQVLLYVPDDDDGDVLQLARFLPGTGKRPDGWQGRGFWMAADAPAGWLPAPDTPFLTE